MHWTPKPHASRYREIADDKKKFVAYGKASTRFPQDVKTTEVLLKLWEAEWEIGKQD
jgi:hypothetical protein